MCQLARFFLSIAVRQLVILTYTLNQAFLMHAKRVTSVAVLVAVFVAGIFFATAGANIFQRGDKIGTESIAATSSVSPVPAVERLALEEAFIEVAAAVAPSVVQIRSEQVVKTGQNRMFFEGTPWEQFFDEPDENSRLQTGLGSGVIIRPDGYIVTNYHVIAQADELEIRLSDGRFFEATVVGADSLSDLAVIRVDTEELPAISYGSMDDVRVGQWVLAFGSPLSEDLDNTVTAGIVSALQRTSRALSRLNLFASFIQTDTAINPGNSGGPLVDLRGNLVGINSAIYSRTGVYQGIGFAIPVDVVQNVISQLIDTGTVERGFLGVWFERVPPALAEAVDAPRGAAQVTQLSPDGPAEKAGLKEGDVITTINGQKLRESSQLRTIVGNMLPGEKVELGVIRNDDELSLTVELGRRMDDLAAAPTTGKTDTPSRDIESSLGLTLQTVSQELLEQMGLGLEERDIRGVLIAAVDQRSTTYRESELRRGDIITEANRRTVTSVDDLVDIYDSVDAGETFLVKVLRPQGSTTRPFFSALSKPE